MSLFTLFFKGFNKILWAGAWVFLIFIQFPLNAQSTNSSVSAVTGKWVIQEGWLDGKEVRLRPKLKSDNKSSHQVLEFQKTGQLNYQYFVPSDLGMCGNGILYLKKSTWRNVGKETMEVNVHGGHIAEDTFSFVKKFKVVKFSKNSIRLISL